MMTVNETLRNLGATHSKKLNTVYLDIVATAKFRNIEVRMPPKFG